MKEDTLTAIGEQVLGWLRASEELVVTQAPLLVEEIIFYGRAKEAAYIVLFGVILIFAPFLMRKCARHMKESSAEDDFKAGVSGFAAGVTLLVGSIGILVHVEPLMLVYCAPKLYVLKWLAYLIR